MPSSFHPLTGINFNVFQNEYVLQVLSFRPLMGINFNVMKFVFANI